MKGMSVQGVRGGGGDKGLRLGAHRTGMGENGLVAQDTSVRKMSRFNMLATPKC